MAVPTLVRSGREVSSTTCDIDVTGGQTLFIYGSVNSGIITNNRASAVTILCYDGAQRRTSVWSIAVGTTGTVRFTATNARLWGYCLVDWPAIQGTAGYTASNTTSAMATVALTINTPAQTAAYWATNNSADWGVTPVGYTDIETITTQTTDNSWKLSISNANQSSGSYTIPAMDRGKNGTARIEGMALVTLIPATLKIETLIDDFTTQIDPAIWPINLRYGTNAWSAERLALTEGSGSYSGVVTDAKWDMNMSSIYCKVTPVPIMTKSTEITLTVRDSANVNGINFIIYSDSGITPFSCLRLRTGGVNDNSFVSYDATINPWIRIRNDATNYYWDVSPDGITWTNLRTLASTLSLSNVLVDISIGQYVVEPQQGIGYFDKINVPSITGLIPGRPKTYLAGTFPQKPGKMWTGSAFVEKPWKRWTGASWTYVWNENWQNNWYDIWTKEH